MTGRVVPEYEALAEELSRIRSGSVVTLTNGCFDVLHVGHVRLLQDAAQQGDILVVALNTDATVRASKGESRPVVPLPERMEVIAAIDGVDYVTSFPEPTADDLILRLVPEVYVKGTDWSPEDVPELETVEAIGARIAICGDDKSHSSTEIARRLR